MKQYYLTFDIGTENLAFCLASFNPKGTSIATKYEILDCGVTCIDGKKLKCCGKIVTINKNGKKSKGRACDETALFYDAEHNGYCKNHKIAGLPRMSSNVIFSREFPDKIDRLMAFLDGLLDTIFTYNVRNLHVHIENQPALKTPIMKTIQVAILSYFRATQTLYPKIIKNVRFVSASIKTAQKFVNALRQKYGLTSKIKTFKEYDERKGFAEEIGEQFVDKLVERNADTRISPLNCACYSRCWLLKKRDDLFDTILYLLRATIFY
jgi:hypothetical protein